MKIDRKEKFIRLIKRIIGDKSQREISQEFGVTAGALTKWKKGDVLAENLTLSTFVKISEALGWSAEQLLVYLEFKQASTPASKLADIINEVEELPLSEKTKLLVWLLSDFDVLVDKFVALIGEKGEESKGQEK